MGRLFIKTTRAQKSFLLQMMLTSCFVTLTSGVFLSGLTLLMGGGDVLASYISVITNVCGIFVLMFAGMLQNAQSQKRATILLMLMSRIVTSLVAIIPLVVGVKVQLYFFVPVILLAFTLQGLANVALNNWLSFYTPTDKRGQYISLRQTISLIISVVFSLLAGVFVDYMDGDYYAFLILFIVAFSLSVFEILVLIKIDDTCIINNLDKKTKQKGLLKITIKNKEFMQYVIRITLFYLFLFISDSFTVVFMLNYLQLSYSTLTLLQMLMMLPQVFLLSLWGKISDKYGHKRVLNLSICIFAGETFFLFLTSSQNWMIFIPIAFLIGSVANSAFVISAFNRRYEIAPQNGRMFYESFFMAWVGIAFIIAPLIGGELRRIIAVSGMAPPLFEFAEIRLVYLVSTIAILLLQAVFAVAAALMSRKQKHSKILKNESIL